MKGHKKKKSSGWKEPNWCTQVGIRAESHVRFRHEVLGVTLKDSQPFNQSSEHEDLQREVSRKGKRVWK